MNRTLILYLCIQLMLVSCQVCTEKPSGKYFCSKFSEAENFIEFHSDGTYNHVFKTNGTELLNRGKWNVSAENNCIIELWDYENYNEEGAGFTEFGIYLLFINGNYLDMDPDEESDTSFKKG